MLVLAAIPVVTVCGYTQSHDLSVQSHNTHTDDPWEVDQNEVGSVHDEVTVFPDIER